LITDNLNIEYLIKSIAYEFCVLHQKDEVTILNSNQNLTLKKNKKKLINHKPLKIENLFKDNINNNNKYFINFYNKTICKNIKLAKIEDYIFIIIHFIIKLFIKEIHSKSVHYFIFSLKIFEEKNKYYYLHTNKIKYLVLRNIPKALYPIFYYFLKKIYSHKRKVKVSKIHFYSNLIIYK